MVGVALGARRPAMTWLGRFENWVATWYGAACYRQERRRLRRRRSWAGEVWRAVPGPSFMAGWQTTTYLDTAEGLVRAPTVAQALVALRAACADDDAALLHLEGLEEALGVRVERG